MKKALCLLLASVLALSLAACSESSAQDSQAGGEKNASSAAAEPTEKPAEKSDPAEQEAAIEVTAKELLKEYDDNEVKADETYRDKLVTVTGIINDIGKDVLDDTYVAVGTGMTTSLQPFSATLATRESLRKSVTWKREQRSP